MDSAQESRITALLGPTNTGKTYLAIERMLAYRSGMIGFPLRLLARENYDRAVKVKGRHQVALVTGEEKIVPAHARYFFCTVESMPLDRPVEFLAIDEVQLAADAERGHVFTDRLLHARGSEETMLLGAETVGPVLTRLVPRAERIARPRFSTLSYAGAKKLTRLPARSAVIAFSAAEVYALAELLRRQRGGTAVVLGALSPRTRNAQVALFEAGEVDYLVATDAIGMGLNLNLDHVAFSRLRKFDGRLPRNLTPAEVGQIAGRAGRHMNDGTFGTTTELGPMDAELVEAVENHRFEPLQAVQWRNGMLDFASADALLRSLERPPFRPDLLRARDADDYLALATLAKDPEIAAVATNPGSVALLWEVCQIPDFRKVLSDQHRALLRRIFRQLMQPEGRLSEDWVAREVARTDRTDGEMDALMARIAHIRTWTYIAQRGAWFADAAHWQARTREIEDRLSDALHRCLAQRFIDRRTAILVKRLKGGDALLSAVRRSGEVLVEGESVGRIEGFDFALEKGVSADDAKAMLSAARRALAKEIPLRLRRLEDDGPETLALLPDGRIAWRGAPIARLAAGAAALAPRVEALPSEFLDSAQRERVRRHLAPWLEAQLRGQLAALYRARETDCRAAVRGLLFQLTEALGVLPRASSSVRIKALTKSERRLLADLAVRLGHASIYLPALQGARARRLTALLWSLYHDRSVLVSLPSGVRPAGGADWPEGLCHATGCRRFERGGRAVVLRVDAVERLAREARKLAQQGPFAPTAALQQLVDCDEPDLTLVLRGLGYRIRREGEGFLVEARDRTRKTADGGPARKARRRRRDSSADSPFSKLRDLKIKS